MIRDGDAHTSVSTFRDKATETIYNVLDAESYAVWFSGPPTTTDIRLYRPFLVFILPLFCCFIKQLTMSVIVAVSLLVSLYFFSWIVSLSEKRTGTLQAIVRVSYAPLLAFFVGISWRPFAGMVVMYLNTIVAAGSCGYAIANHRQRIGAENSAQIAAIMDLNTIVVRLCIPLHHKERKEKGLEDPDLVAPAFLLCLASLAFAVWTVWMSCTYNPAGDVAAAIMDLSVWLSIGLFPWACFVDGGLMDRAIFSSYTLQMLFLSCFMMFMMLMTVFLVIFGDSGVAIITWLTAMAAAGLFGYTIAVYHQYSSRCSSRRACHRFVEIVTHCLGQQSSPYNSTA
ncbi:hypothetical protein QOZ80_2BG0170670 [Eleusine coracana subsp. coracana]|nr:hypothetical protein QOZ80_2BG0170670 [Eleusine coracana subsp. coracana]